MNFKFFCRVSRRPFESAGILFIFGLCKILPLKIIRLLGYGLGSILYCVPSTRKLTMANLAIAFPEYSLNRRRRIAYLSVSNSIITLLEFFWSYCNKNRLNKFLQISEEYKNIFKQENGLLFLGLHLGNWEFSSIVLGLNSHKDIFSIARKIKNSFLEKLIYKGRVFSGIDICHEDGAARQFVGGLKNKQSVALIIDQNTPLNQGGVLVNFFNLPVCTTRLPATLMNKFKPDVYFVVVLRTARGFKVNIEKCCVNEGEDIELISQRLVLLGENYVRQYPEQWIWLYERWNYIAPNTSDYPYYAK